MFFWRRLLYWQSSAQKAVTPLRLVARNRYEVRLERSRRSRLFTKRLRAVYKKRLRAVYKKRLRAVHKKRLRAVLKKPVRPTSYEVAISKAC